MKIYVNIHYIMMFSLLRMVECQACEGVRAFMWGGEWIYIEYEYTDEINVNFDCWMSFSLIGSMWSCFASSIDGKILKTWDFVRITMRNGWLYIPYSLSRLCAQNQRYAFLPLYRSRCLPNTEIIKSNIYQIQITEMTQPTQCANRRGGINVTASQYHIAHYRPLCIYMCCVCKGCSSKCIRYAIVEVDVYILCSTSIHFH